MAGPERNDPLSAEDSQSRSNVVDGSHINNRKNENGNVSLEKQGVNGSPTVANNEVAVTVGDSRSSQGPVQSALLNHKEENRSETHVNDVRRAAKGPGSLDRTRPKKAILIQVESDDDVEEWPEVPLLDSKGQDNKEDLQEQEEGQTMEEPECSGRVSLDQGEDDQATIVEHNELFLKHKVRQKDTLAGLAVKYKVSISDIKRANGYQTDSALYGKEWVIIPRKPLPIGPEHAAWAGMILAHYEQRMPYGIHPDGNNSPTMSALRGYYSTESSPTRRAMYNLHTVDADETFSKKNEDGHLLAPAQKEVELMTRSTTYVDDRLRRRRHDDLDANVPSFSSRSDDYDENDAATRQIFDAMRDRDMPKPLFSAAATAKFNAWRDRSSSGAMQEFRNFQNKSIRWRDQLINKIKKAASQPALSAQRNANNPGPSASSLKKD